ncbi:MAG: hypothetical protein KF862_02015 [Chitinophagaceae bacterium]|nr:hypothetical protein [Chitinophagaceae bacterium]
MQSPPRKRFHKPCHLPNKAGKQFFEGFEAVFQNFQPEDFRKELNQ